MPLRLEDYFVGQLPTLCVVQDYVDQSEEQRLLNEIRSCRAKWTVVSGRRLQNHGGTVMGKGLLKAPMPRWLQGLVERLSADTGVYGAGPANHVLINSYQPGEGIMPHEDGPLYHPAVCILSLAAPAVIRFWQRRPPLTEQQQQQPPPQQQDGTEQQEQQQEQRQLPPPPQRHDEGAEQNCSGHAKPLASVVLPPRSLLVFRGAAYTDCLHGIVPVEAEVIDPSVANAAQCGLAAGSVLPRGGERVSLTVRRVLRTHALAIRL